MSSRILFGPDCSSYQGQVDWLKVSAVCAFGAEKVTEGAGATAYVNPFWPESKREMLARQARGGFIPLAYMFLDAVESGRAQARYFASEAGNLDRFGLVVDFERAPNGPPTLQQARDCTDELRRLYPHHPVGGYCPHWYTGGEDLRFVDWLWASSYVIGSGDPGMLYTRVPAAWWAPYGDMDPLLLQFTSQALITGIGGQVDCSAFHGDRAKLARAVLPRPKLPPPPPPPPPPHSPPPVHTGDSDMTPIILAPGAPAVHVAVWADAADYKEPLQASNVSLVLAGETGTVVQAVLYHSDGAPENFSPQMSTGRDVAIVPERGWATVRTIRLQRLDSRPDLGASAAFRTW